MEPPNALSTIIYIDHECTKYPLNLNVEGDVFNFSLEYNSGSYFKKIPLNEIKDKESKPIFLSQTPKDFINFLLKLSEMKKISLVKKENLIIIKFEIEMMFKKHEIEIELKDKNSEIIEKELKQLKEENEELKKRILNLETEMEKIKNKLKDNEKTNYLNAGNKSVIMQENEFNIINLGIKNRINKKIKEIKKIYQATIDGDTSSDFHSKCDNIPNTLILFKTEGNRRFGGFTTIPWTSEENGKYLDDKNAFLFSIDKQRIYPLKSNEKGVYHHKNYGPCFRNESCWDIYIYDHCIENKSFYTNESSTYSSYNYNGDNNALSESNGSYIYLAEYEVFQVIFE